MKEKDLKIEKLLIEIYYGIDDETGELLFDEDSMREICVRTLLAWVKTPSATNYKKAIYKLKEGNHLNFMSRIYRGIDFSILVKCNVAIDFSTKRFSEAIEAFNINS